MQQSNANPLTRLEFARQEIDRIFGQGYAAAHPEILAVVMQSATTDWAAARLAAAVESVASALLIEEETAEAQQCIVRPGLVQMRP